MGRYFLFQVFPDCWLSRLVYNFIFSKFLFTFDRFTRSLSHSIRPPPNFHRRSLSPEYYPCFLLCQDFLLFYSFTPFARVGCSIGVHAAIVKGLHWRQGLEGRQVSRF